MGQPAACSAAGCVTHLLVQICQPVPLTRWSTPVSLSPSDQHSMLLVLFNLGNTHHLNQWKPPLVELGTSSEVGMRSTAGVQAAFST